ncbi:MAG: 3-hydroxyacyl-CoA dehydrogenase [Hyphomicrobiales bacterium]|nr:MAG: 3-hydroxyacyl-CoA dehydrogenase [Hyphomicrobiales bacterium]
MSKIAIIGCGLIGRAWAISFAKGSMDVALWDQDAAAPEAALSYISEILQELEAHDLLGGASAVQVLARIRIAVTLKDAVSDADHIQENTPEFVEIKRKVFAELDALAPKHATIASSTSALLPSTFTQELKGRHRCMVMHPLNPPYLIPAVEMVPAPWTTDTAMESAKNLLIEAGHAPIVMKRELEGFVMNRLQGALLEEAFRLVDKGYASAEDVDVALREGLALRWSFMGPFETIDLNAPNGIRDYVARYESVYIPVFEQANWRADWSGPVLDEIEQDRRQNLPADKLNERQKWRDKRLIALMAHKKQAEKDLGQ